MDRYLKRVKHPANSYSLQQLKLKYKFQNCFHFGAAVTKIFNKTKSYPLKKFLETLSLFSHLNFQIKRGFCQNWIGDVMLLQG